MNYTENYHLPQWEETDRIMMDDFNDAMAGIEEGITEAKAAAVDAAVATYVAGSYTGTGAECKVVTGFRPRMLLIHTVRLGTYSQQDTLTAFFLESPAQNTLSYEDDGFSLRPYSSSYYPYVNVKDRKYAYIAFR